MSISDGQPVNATASNSAWLSKNTDETMPNTLGLASTDPADGSAVASIQKAANTLYTATGASEVADGTTYGAPASTISNGDSHQSALTKIANKFHVSTGHMHTGAAGDAPPVDASYIANVPLLGMFLQGTDLTGVTGSTTNVSTQMSGKAVSSGSTVSGVVVTASYNKIVLRYASGTSTDDQILDSLGNVVYGRITNSGGSSGTWTISYYVELSAVETSYSFGSSTDIRWYYQQLYNPMLPGFPVYSQLAIIPSDNATADVLTATTSTQGKTQLASSAAASVGSSNSAGTANATVANSDHAHQGVHAVNGGGTNLFGDIIIAGASGSSVSQSSQTITVTSPALSATAAASVGSSNSAGTAATSSKSDHVHQGVHAINGGSSNLFGDVILSGGSGITVSQSSQTITIAATGSVSGTSIKNSLLNGAFDVWQAGTSVTVANGVSTYQADQWYVKNSLGTSGVITFSQVAGAVDGSKYGASVKITTAPTAAQTNGTELYQLLENRDALPYYNQNGSFTIKVKSLGNVNQVGVQFFYATTEAKLTTAIGSEVLTTANTSTFSSCTISGQAMGTSQTTSGVVGVRIRITGVSSGNTYDLNNGFIVEQAMMNTGSSAGTFIRNGATIGHEFNLCRRFYSTTYDEGSTPGALNYNGALTMNPAIITGASTATTNWNFPMMMRLAPSITLYNGSSGATGSWRDQGGADVTVGTLGIGQMSVGVINTGSASLARYLSGHVVADARI